MTRRLASGSVSHSERPSIRRFFAALSPVSLASSPPLLPCYPAPASRLITNHPVSPGGTQRGGVKAGDAARHPTRTAPSPANAIFTPLSSFAFAATSAYPSCRLVPHKPLHSFRDADNAKTRAPSSLFRGTEPLCSFAPLHHATPITMCDPPPSPSGNDAAATPQEEMLMAMGFALKEIRKALLSAHNDVQTAVSYLMNDLTPPPSPPPRQRPRSQSTSSLEVNTDVVSSVLPLAYFPFVPQLPPCSTAGWSWGQRCVVRLCARGCPAHFLACLVAAADCPLGVRRGLHGADRTRFPPPLYP